ncbi:uroporphyrinogen-III synthase [Pseudomarimonas arenosa]|uniref:Uroporphyrinogen-III synthase n=1 Tax=Pseudomarimonas arenosa TaxID=2774145 RepID=A0AAW3ZVC8_9GAMM|nr:uroporphyrinogen-III synthase [Pseudomarimonas arenosa]MBD8527996.1 uroporphyrinogen-III synthase [Pseudomarimonas arenosa]
MTTAENRTPLNGLRLIVLRPASELRRLARQVAQAGGTLISAPVLHRRLLLNQVTAQRLHQAARAELCLFTSRFAVEAASRQINLSEFRGIQLAVGPGTAAALQAAGARRVQHPQQQASSEALLAMPALQGAADVWLLGGVGGRGLIDSELAAQGCRVQRIDLYQRVARKLAAPRRQALLALPSPPLLAISSIDALIAWLQDPELAAISRHWPLLASSQRIAAALAERQLPIATVARSAQPDDLLMAALAYAKQAPFR